MIEQDDDRHARGLQLSEGFLRVETRGEHQIGGGRQDLLRAEAADPPKTPGPVRAGTELRIAGERRQEHDPLRFRDLQQDLVGRQRPRSDPLGRRRQPHHPPAASNLPPGAIRAGLDQFEPGPLNAPQVVRMIARQVQRRAALGFDAAAGRTPTGAGQDRRGDRQAEHLANAVRRGRSEHRDRSYTAAPPGPRTRESNP